MALFSQPGGPVQVLHRLLSYLPYFTEAKMHLLEEASLLYVHFRKREAAWLGLLCALIQRCQNVHHTIPMRLSFHHHALQGEALPPFES